MPRRVAWSAATAFSAIVVAITCGACGPTPAPSPTRPPTPAPLTMDATGLGPCKEMWYTTCNYGIRVEGPGGYDHRGNFAWDEGRPTSGTGELEHGPAANVASTGTYGDVAAALPPGLWTISFRLWYGSDAIQYGPPVPGGTPRIAAEDPFTPACSTQVDTAGATSVTLHVAFDGPGCKVETLIGGR